MVSAITGPIATCLLKIEMNGPAIASGMGTCGMVGPIGVYTGWMQEITAGTRTAVTTEDWMALISICVIIPAILTIIIGMIMRHAGWIKPGDLKLE